MVTRPKAFVYAMKQLIGALDASQQASLRAS